MTKLSDTQAVILSAAAQRDDGAVLPLPETLKIKGGTVERVLGSLKAKGLIDHQGTPRGDDPPPLRITRAGLRAIGVETEEDAPDGPAPADTAPTSADAGAHGVDAPVTALASEAEGAPNGAKSKPARGKGKKAGTNARVPSESAAAGEPSAKPTPRAGTKQAQLIDMLMRPEGATVEQIAAATGWQHHTIRGAISGALKKKLGLTVEATRTREVGPTRPAPRAARPPTGSLAEERAMDYRSARARLEPALP